MKLTFDLSDAKRHHFFDHQFLNSRQIDAAIVVFKFDGRGGRGWFQQLPDELEPSFLTSRVFTGFWYEGGNTLIWVVLP